MSGLLSLTCSCGEKRVEMAASLYSSENLIDDYEYDYLESGQIVITAYSGEESVVIVPEKIEGKQVATIGDTAFYKNYKVTRVLLPEGIEKIGKGAFEECANMEYIVLPSTVKEIEENAFANAKHLKELRFPNGIQLIAPAICKDCTSLESVYFPAGVQIESDSFSGCEQLKLIYGYDDIAKNYALEHNYTYVDLNRVIEEGNIAW